MGKSVIICEKSSVANTYANVLHVYDRKNGYYENESYIITWSVGHLVTLSYPEKYDPALKNWKLEDLPFLPEKYKYEVISSVAAQYKVVKEIYHRNDIDCIYYAGDAGREGLYIQMLIRMMAGHTPGVEELVVWIDSQTNDEIINGISNAKDVSTYDNMAQSGYMRAIEDYSLGINFSRLLTLKYAVLLNNAAGIKKYKPLSVGRVMSCVLGMICQREYEINNFKPTAFFKPAATLSINNVSISAEWHTTEHSAYYNSPLLYNEKGFLKEEDANAMLSKLPSELYVQEVEQKTERKNAPLLYNLAELQAECSAKLKISPDQTLAVAQSLYEKKLTTYPRTDARVLSSAIACEIEKNITGLKQLETYTPFVEHILESNTYSGIIKSKYTNDEKITDHYAIIPTGTGIDNLAALSVLESKVYDLICRRFLSIFYPPAEYQKITVKLQIDNEEFVTYGKYLTALGYYEVSGYPDKQDDKKDYAIILSTFHQGDKYECTYEINKGETKPPSRYTSGTIVLAMENAGQLIEDEELREEIKKNGIGTSATRAEIIKKLILLAYVKLNEKTQVLSPTNFGCMFYELLKLTLPSLLNPIMSASWEKGLNGIAMGLTSKEQYHEKLYQYIRQETESIKNNDIRDELIRNIKHLSTTKDFSDKPHAPEPIGVKCPVCGGDIMTASFGFGCSNYKKGGTGCNFAFGTVMGKQLTAENVKDLIERGITKEIKGFKSNQGKSFSAMLKMTMEGSQKKLEFVFKEPEKVRGIKCPQCGGGILKNDLGFRCENYTKEGDGCHFIVGKIAGKKISEKFFYQLIRNGITEEIEGFKSKTGKKFSARLKLENGQISFDFPNPDEKTESNILCPSCKRHKLTREQWTYTCPCGYSLSHTICGKRLSEADISKLVATGKTKLITGFKSQKPGKSSKSFSAYIVLNDDGKTSFEFPPAKPRRKPTR